ncbi:MAG: phosphate permease [Actinobacteria bacterium]|nr:phosphate permease [Actinomycetota bacterium]
MTLLLIIAIIVAFYMAFGIGSNDGANSMADAVGAKAIPIFWALILAAICEFGGAVLVGSQVSNTIRKGIIDVQAVSLTPQILAYGMVCALLASAIWLHLASVFGMPVSTTHSIVGSIFGFGLLCAGFDSVNWAKMGQIVASWLISPLAGGLMAYVIFKLISRHILGKNQPIRAALKGIPLCVFITFATVTLAIILKGLKNLHLDFNGTQALLLSVSVGAIAAIISVFLMRRVREAEKDLSPAEQLLRVEKTFIPLVIITSCSVAFAHGANDVANAIGPLAAVVEIAKTNDVPRQVNVDLWVLLLGGVGIAAGLMILGYRVIRTVGANITDLTPSRGVAADIAATITVLVCSKIGLPISTTHTLIGAIIGVGLARGITAINARIVRSIFFSWILTIPFTAGLTILFYLASRLVIK